MTASVAILLLSTASAGVLPTTVESVTLDNGLRIFLAPMDTPGVAAWQAWVEVGSRNEVEPGTTGFAHFFEHLLFYGGPQFPAEVRDREMLLLGADENAWTWVDDTNYHSTIASDALPRLIEIEADRFLGMSLKPEWVEKEAGAVYGEYRKGRSDPWERTYDALYETAFTTHTYRHSTIGYEADIDAMPQRVETAGTFFDTHYTPEKVRIVIAGDFDRDAVMGALNTHFGPWEAGSPAPEPEAEPVQEESLRVDVPWDGGPTNSWLMMGWKVPGFDPADPDQAALSVISDLLFAEVAPLYRELVVDDARLIAMSGGDWQFVDPHLFLITGMLRDPADASGVQTRIEQELARFAEQGPSVEELAAAQGHALKAAQVALDTPESVAYAIGTFTRLGGPPELIDTWYDNYAAVTVDDVKRVVASTFVPEGLTVAVLDLDAEPEPESESEPDSESEPGPEAKSEPQSEPQSEPESEPTSEEGGE